MLEGLAYEHGRVLEDMALDSRKLAVAVKYYMLEQIFFAQGEEEISIGYGLKFKDKWNLFLSQVKFDTSQDGTEDSEVTKFVRQRLYT
jgi:hypothetical protein